MKQHTTQIQHRCNRQIFNTHASISRHLEVQKIEHQKFGIRKAKSDELLTQTRAKHDIKLYREVGEYIIST